VSRDLSFLEVKPTDSSELRAMKSYWQVAMAMPEAERKVFLQQEVVASEEKWLQRMIDSNRSDDDMIAYFSSQAYKYVKEYESSKDEMHIELAEAYTETAQSVADNKYKISQIRKQRERVQWEKTKLNQMTKPQ
jgi:hypothetical protein